MRKAITIIALGACLHLLFFLSASAQYPFGKNKIQYAPKDWKIIETPHAEIFYYPDERAIAEFIAGITEGIYEEYAAYFNMSFERRIPIILYGTHHDFKETNVIPFMISESTAGFTEFIKGRVALPFMGSYAKLRAVYRHELTHAFMLEKLRLVMKAHRRFNYMHPPLWFTEGLAEFVAHRKPDSEAEMFIRDAVTSGTLLPLKEMWRIEGTYMMYKVGENVLHYIATRFGDEAIPLILENWWKSDKFDIVLRSSIGMDVEELSDEWEEYLRRRYFPSILNRRRITEIAEQLSPEERSFENHPICIRDRNGKERYICIGFGLGSIDLIELNQRKNGKWKNETLIRGGSSTAFESIPLLRSRISARGDTLLFVAKRGERDAIYLFDVTDRKVLDKLMFQDLRILNSPSLSRDGRRCVFSGIDNYGKVDLFVYTFEGERLDRLTDDYFEDADPDWHPDGRRIVFSSDRCMTGLEYHTAIYTIDAADRMISPLTDGNHIDREPRWLPDGSGVLFSSNRDGAFDVFLLTEKTIIPQTSVLGGAFEPTPCVEGVDFLTAVYSGGTYKVYRSPLKRGTNAQTMRLTEKTGGSWRPGFPDSSSDFTTRDYGLKFGIDFIGAAFAVDPDFGYMGNGAQLFLTDILGNHQLIVLFGSASDDFDDFWRNINVAFTYVNLESRLNYAFGAFHLASYMGTFYDLLRFERRYGVLGAISYPISKFTRVELSAVVKGMERDDDITYLGIQEGKSWLVSNYLSFTTDNIVWYIGGPLKGHRMNVSFGNTLDLKGSRYESTTLHFDLRNYVNLTRRIIFAQRLVSRNAWGSDLQLFYLGGSWDLRGYEFREFAGKHVLLLNNEIRFPLLDRLFVGLPFGHIDFPLFRGSLFLDVGRAYGFLGMDTEWLGSFGAGIEMNMGYLPVIRLNFTRRTDFKEIEKDTRIGFFLGFNF